MIKKKLFKIVLFLLMLSFTTSVNAEEITTGRVAAINNLNIRSGPGTNYEVIGSAKYNSTVIILEDGGSGTGCSKNWFKISSNDNSVTGYVCSLYIEDIVTNEVVETPIGETGETMANMTTEEFEQYLTDQGFPESYKVKLRQLHALHPTWIFKGIKSNYSWEAALNEQDESGTSLMNVNPTYAQNGYEGYLSTAPEDYNHDTDTFIRHDGTYWFQANRQTIAYYLDPRNFLDEKQVFMFEELFYYPSYQTLDVVRYTLSSEFLRQYAAYFVEGAEVAKVSPVYLAALSKQEVGTSNTNIVTNGQAGVIEGVDYTGYYNFFNIGAASSPNPKLASLKRAKQKNWNTQRKAIVEGSEFVSYNYVNCGQYTSYFQKFNLAPTATKPMWHQYTTNITGLVSPAKSTYNAYKNFGLIEKDFTFAIPIYANMPDVTTLPNLGNPNNWLKTLKVNGSLVTNFDNDKLNYTVNIAYAETVRIDAESINSKATIEGIGNIPLTGKTTVVKVIVTAQNNAKRTYTLTIVRGDNPNGETNTNPPTPTNPDDPAPATPDVPTPTTTSFDDVIKSSGYGLKNNYLTKITLGSSVNTVITNLTKKYKTITVNIKDKDGNPKTDGTVTTGDKVILSENGNTKIVNIVIYGDIDGNGSISVVDLLLVQKHILGYTKQTSSYLEACDVNKDSKITVVDLLMIQKHILNINNISQG